QTEVPPSLMEATLGEEFPQELENIVSTLLAKEAGDRFQSALELGIALRDLKKSGSAPTAAPGNKTLSIKKPWQSRTDMAITHAIALVSIVCLGLRLVNLPKPAAQNPVPAINENAPAAQIIRELPKLSEQERADTQAAYEAKYTPGVRSVDYRGYSL